MVALNVFWVFEEEIVDEKLGGPYFTQISNILDFFIVVVSVIDM